MSHVLLAVLHILFIIGMAWSTGRLLAAGIRLLDHESGGARLTPHRFVTYRRQGFVSIFGIILFIVLYFVVPY